MKKGVTGAAIGAAAVGAAAAGYYFYGSKNAAKHRKTAAKWAVKAEKEIQMQAKKLKAAAMNEKNYKQIVQTVAKKYQGIQKLSAKDVSAFVKGFEGGWKKMGATAKKSAAPAKKAVKKAVKKVAKAVKKVTKK